MGRRRAALSSIWRDLGSEELALQVFDRPLQRVDDPRYAGWHDFDASVARDAELVTRPYRRLHRGAVRRDGEDHAVLLVDERADAELALGHRLDHRLELLVPAEVGLWLWCDPAHRLPELVEKGRRTAHHRPDQCRRD